MKDFINLIIFGLLIILLTNGISSGKIIQLKDKVKDRIDSRSEAAETRVSEIVKNSEDHAELKIAFKLASELIPSPFGPVIGLATSVFFSYINIPKNESEPVTIQYMEKKFEHLETSINLAAERIITELTHVIEKEPINRGFTEDINEFNITFENHFAPCFLSSDNDSLSCDVSRNIVLDDLTLRTSPFRKRLERFIFNWVSPSTITHEKRKGIFDLISEKYEIMENSGRNCYGRSEQLKIFDLFKRTTIELARTYSMVTMANMIRYNEIKTNKTSGPAKVDSASIILTIKEFQNGLAVMEEKVEEILNKSSRDIRSCEPDEYKQGRDYERLTYFIRGAVMELCFSEKSAASRLEKHPKHFDCEEIPDYTSVTCYYHIDDYERIYHHFDVITSKGITTYGNPVNKNPENKLSTIEHWRGVKCRNTMGYFCTVDLLNNGREGVRSLSLDYVGASPGYVVTGIRWVVKNQIIYLEIKEGKLIDSLTVDPETVKWKITPENRNNVLYLMKTDVHGFVLDNISLSPGAVVTGVQFMSKNRLAGIRVYGDIPTERDSLNPDELIINNRPFPEIVEPIINATRWNSKGEIKLNKPDRSELGKNHKVYKEPGEHHILFQHTDFKKDAGQTTVPYLGIREVVTKPSSPVGGVGIYYKGSEGFGGYVELKLLSMDLSHIVNKKRLESVSKMFDSILKKSTKLK